MSRPTPEAVASTDRRARDILGKTYEDAKRLARMLAERRTDEDTEAAGMMGALIFRVLNAESEVDRLRRELFAFAWEADQFSSCLQDNDDLRAEIVRLRSSP